MRGWATQSILYALILVSVLPFVVHADTAADKRDKPMQKTGIDPTDISTRIEGAYTYNDRADGTTLHNLNIRLEREFTGRGMNIRLDVPLSYADVPDAESQSGVGDLSLRLNYRFKHTPGHSALVGGTLTMDTASDDALGDETTRLSGVYVNSWRKRAWMLSAVVLGAWSESGEEDAAGLVPIVAYQPMAKYLSYVTVGLPVVRDLDDGETITLGILRFGKVFQGGHVAYLGTRYDLSDNADDDLVVTVGYRRMF